MLITKLLLIFTFAVNCVVIWLVYKSNPTKPSNRMFVFFGMFICVWNINVYLIVGSRFPSEAAFWIRSAFAMGSLVPVFFYLLADSVGRKVPGFPAHREFRALVLLSACGVLLAVLPPFVRRVVIPEVAGIGRVPNATYGWPFYIHTATFIASIGVDLAYVHRRLRGLKGFARIEFQYFLMGILFGILFVFMCNIVSPIILQSDTSAQFSPIGVLIMNGFIGYGIARYKILDLSFLMERFVGNVLFALGVLVLYAGSFAAAEFLAGGRGGAARTFWIGLFGLCFAAAFVMSRDRIVTLVNSRLFSHRRSTEKVVRELDGILYAMTTLDELLRRCLAVIVASIGIDRAAVHAVDEREGRLSLLAAAPSAGLFPAGPVSLPRGMAAHFETSHDVLIREEIERRPPSPVNAEIAAGMARLGLETAVPLFLRNRLWGFLGCGGKISGRPYTPEDESVLLVFSQRLALTVENFLLYTELAEAKGYQESLLENLPSGVIGVDRDGAVTVLNKEAGRILGLGTAAAGVHYARVLPSPVKEAFDLTLRTRSGLRNREMSITGPSGDVPLNVSSSVFFDGADRLLGVQVIVTDVSQIKLLEEEVRRVDRLASLGVMAAGIAHEIKNPLVSIRTFASLLPTRFDDAEFRETFSTLAVSEVDRINALVEQMLLLARPGVSHFRETDVAEVVRSTLLLFRMQAGDRRIAIEEDVPSGPLTVTGDAEKLKQAFLNILMNSGEALGDRGTIRVAVRADGTMVRTMIADDGPGVGQEMLDRIFDPFFTTKPHGTGLGLSIVERIVNEHGGRISVARGETAGLVVTVELPRGGAGGKAA